ncbi:hypothetical protein MP213Fo_25700 [Pseudochrobactrum sp. MP213Fo]
MKEKAGGARARRAVFITPSVLPLRINPKAAGANNASKAKMVATRNVPLPLNGNVLLLKYRAGVRIARIGAVNVPFCVLPAGSPDWTVCRSCSTAAV